MNKIIITKFNDRIVTAEIDDDRVVDLNFESDSSYHIDDIFVGKVDSIAKNINAAFIEIGDGVKCFYQMKKGDDLNIGDELPVQIIKEAVKTKDAECSIKLSIPGKYVVVSEGLYKLGISSKIPDNDRRFELQQLFDSTFSFEDNNSFILRTNAEDATDDEILSEAKAHIIELKNLREKSKFVKPFKKIFAGNSYYNDKIRDYHGEISVVTDIKDIYEEILSLNDELNVKLYDDEMLPLSKLYKLESAISDISNKKVWLKSGGYLVIEETEALTVIDVNTGKNETSRKMEETFLKTNLEAAKECALQLRLRNLSGIIIVDFIDMAEKSHMDEVVYSLKQELKKDSVKSVFVDVTKLNLVEITRKKVYKSIKEQMS